MSWIQNESFFNEEVSKSLKYIEDNRALQNHTYVSKAGKAGNVESTNEEAYPEFNWTNKSLRLLALFRYWNFVEYYYPYKYQTDQDWDNVLIAMIPEFLASTTELEYHLTMLKLVTNLDDSHAGLTTPLLNDFFGTKFIPVIHRIIDDKAIITAFFNDSLAKINDLKVGDVITKVSGKKIIEVLNERNKYLQGGNPSAKNAYAWNKIFNGSTDSIEIEYYRDNKLMVNKIVRYPFNEFQFKRPQEEGWRKINDNIGYVNMGSLVRGDIPEMTDNLIDTKSIIFDLRNYPKDFLFGSLGFLFSSNKHSSFFKSIVPDLTYPGRFVWKEGDKFSNKSDRYYQGKVIILVNERSISLAEFTAMYLQTVDNSITIGSQTLAADGNVSRLEFLGGYKTGITGIGIFYPDGTETQRVGVRIDLEVKPTIEGIKQGRDEVLEKAIEIALN